MHVAEQGAGGRWSSSVARSMGTPPAIYVKNQIANLREGAGVNFHVIGTAPRGTRLAVIGEAGSEQNKWFKVKLSDGREAWVAASVVALNP